MTNTSQHWPATIVACVLIAGLAAIYVVSSPDQRSQLLLGAGGLAVAIQSLMPAIRKFAGVPLLALAFFGTTMSGCGASAPVVVAGVETGIEWTCVAAHKICDWTQEDPPVPASFRDRACLAINEVCGVVAPGSK